MPVEGIPGYLRYRVLNPNTGAEVIGDLPHLHQSTWTVRSLQGGMPGSTTIGDFSIPLPAPYSDDGRQYNALYQKLQKGQKVEGYLGNVGAGDPRFTGVITKLQKPLAQPWVISGSDTLWWQQQSQVYDGELIGPGITAGLIATYMGTREVVFDGAPTSFVGTWNSVGADPEFALPALSYVPVAVNNATAITASSWNAVSEYSWPSPPSIARGASITAWGTAFAGTDTARAATFGVTWLWDSATTTGYMAHAIMAQTGVGSGLYNVSVEMWKFVSGSGTLLASAANVFTNIPPTLPFQFCVNLYNLAQTNSHIATLILNGKNTGVSFAVSHANLAATSGKVGYWAGAINVGGSPIIYFNNLRFDSRTGQTTTGGAATTWGTDRFTAGTISNGTSQFEQIPGQGQTQLDMLMLAATLDGYDLRKTPKAGYKSDQLDYGPNLGVDRSNQVVFEEGVNLVADQTQVTEVADLFATATRINAVPGVNSGGTVTWVAPANGENVGGNPSTGGDIVLLDTVSDVGIPGAALSLSYAAVVATRKAAAPPSAVQVQVLRTTDLADVVKELDYVTVHIPTLGVNRQKIRVVGYTFQEGQLTQLYYLQQFPDRLLVQQQVQRLVRSVEWVTNPLTYS